MSIKRLTQHTIRYATSLLRDRSLTPLNVVAAHEALAPLPAGFGRSVFNFCVDFELLWGNGNLGGIDHSRERRVEAARTAAACFYPFVDLVSELDFPTSWAIVGRLVDDERPTGASRFQPTWATGDWYDFPGLESLPASYYDGRSFVEHLVAHRAGDEFMTHSFWHIDFADEATSAAVASWDLARGVAVLEQFGLSVHGLVFPCNRPGHCDLLARHGITMARGRDARWAVQDGVRLLPVGTWLSPAFFTVREVRRLIDDAIARRAFLSLWIHLNECDRRMRDLTRFYRPILEYVRGREAAGEIEVLPYRQICDRWNAPE